MRRGFVGWTAAIEPKSVPIVVDLAIDGRFVKSLRAVRQQMGRYGASPGSIIYLGLDDPAATSRALAKATGHDLPLDLQATMDEPPTDLGDIPRGNTHPEDK